MKVQGRNLCIRENKYSIDGTNSFASPVEGAFEFAGQLYFNVKVLENLNVNHLVSEIFSEYGVDTVTLLLSDPHRERLFLGLELASELYGWFCMAIGKEAHQKTVSFDDEESALWRISKKSILTENLKNELATVWQRDYIEKLFGSHPEKMKKAQLASYQHGVLGDGAGTHYCFWRGKQLSAHLQLKTVFFPALGDDSIVVHYWVDQGLPKNDRKKAHGLIWEKIRSAEITYPRFANVGEKNKKGIHYLLQNGGVPIHLRVRKTEAYLREA